MKCKEIEPSLTAYLDRELSEAEVSAIEAHLALCTGCSKTLDELRSASLRAAMPVEIPADLAQRLLARTAPTGRRWTRPLFAGASALAIGVAVFLGSAPRPASAAYQDMLRTLGEVRTAVVESHTLNQQTGEFQTSYRWLTKEALRFEEADGKRGLHTRDGIVIYDQDEGIRPWTGFTPSFESQFYAVTVEGVVGLGRPGDIERLLASEAMLDTHAAKLLEVQYVTTVYGKDEKVGIVEPFTIKIWLDPDSNLPVRREAFDKANGKLVQWEEFSFNRAIPSTMFTKESLRKSYGAMLSRQSP